jgi:xylan 1,4-beta-xylosidase
VGAGDYIVRLARDGLSVVGKRHFIYKGWPIPKRWDVECSCLEGPKILFHHGFYYLFSAEGGTSGPPTSHMVVVARSRNLRGPWQNSPFNPLVHTYSRHDTWWSTGHGTVIQAPDKKWYVIFHGYRRHYLTLGRSVLMEPVRWTKSGWLKLLLGTRPSLPLPIPESNAIQRPMNLSDNFAGHKLGLQWQFWGPVPAGRFSLANHTLRLKAVGPGIASSSPLLCMAIARAYSITVSVTVHPGTKAGLVLYYDPSEYISVGIGDGDWWFGQHGHSSGAGRFTAHHAVVRIVNDHNAIEMYVGKTVDTLRKVGISLYAGGYTTQTFGGYLSLRPGLYATGKGTAVFRHFKYSLIHRRTRSRFRR